MTDDKDALAMLLSDASRSERHEQDARQTQSFLEAKRGAFECTTS